MRLKSNSIPLRGWDFMMYGPDQKAIRVVGESKDNLFTNVRQQFVALGMEVPDNINEIIEHQMCLRDPDPKARCWESGIGDAIHQKFAVPFLKAVELVAQKAKLAKVQEAAQFLESCSACSGTQIYDANDKHGNMGRAGKLNKLG